MKTLFEFLQAKHLKSQYEAIDLGLSVKWANCNVGAENPEDYGLLFQWGRTDGYPYDSELGTSFEAKDGLIKTKGIPITTASGKNYKKGDVLELEDDAAYANMKDNWRMPTADEMQELLDNTTHEWTKLNGVNGFKFVSKKDETKSIFIPAAGYFSGQNGFCRDSGYNGNVWSSSVSIYNSNLICYLDFCTNNCGIYNTSCEYGQYVRGVCK